MIKCRFENIFTRRDFLHKSVLGLGTISIASLLNPNFIPDKDAGTESLLIPHFTPKAKHIIYLFQSGGPSQLDLFDYKPLLNKYNGQEMPINIIGNHRGSGISAGQGELILTGTHFKFKQRGESGAWVSELMPNTAKIVDDLCFVKSMYTEPNTHDQAATFMQTGFQLPGRPSIGAWLSYGLGSDNENLPNFVVLITKDKHGQPLSSRLWGNGFLPTQHRGLQLRTGRDPMLYLNNPPGISNEDRRNQLDILKKLENINFQNVKDPEIKTRINQYEIAYKMQTSVPAVLDLKDEPQYIYDMYGPDSKIPGTYAANALLARRLVEKGVKTVQLYHPGWDHHENLPSGIKVQCRETDRATAALINDLKQRGLLEDTLVVWGGEFGRTCYAQGPVTLDNYGRDYHSRCFTVFMAGGGVKAGFSYGSTDDFGYNIAENPMHVHDLQATILYLMGIDHKRLIYKHQGRRYRLTDQFGVVNQAITS